MLNSLIRNVWRSVKRQRAAPDGLNLAAAADGAATGLKIATNEAALNSDVLAALERWRHVDDATLAQLELALTTKHGVYADPGLLNALEGFTAEEIAARELHAALPNATNVEAYDLVRDGVELQVKEGSSAAQHALEAASQHPEIPLVVDPDTASTLAEHGIRAIPLESLDPSTVHLMTERTAAAIQHLNDIADFTPEIPVVSSVLCAIKSVRDLNAGRVDAAEAVANLSVEVGSRSVAIAAAGVIACMFFDIPSFGTIPIGAAVLGGISGRHAAARLVAARVPKRILDALLKPFREHYPGSVARAQLRDKDPKMRAAIEEAIRKEEAAGRTHTAWEWGKIEAQAVTPIFKRLHAETVERHVARWKREAAEAAARLDAEIARLERGDRS